MAVDGWFRREDLEDDKKDPGLAGRHHRQKTVCGRYDVH